MTPIEAAMLVGVGATLAAHSVMLWFLISGQQHTNQLLAEIKTAIAMHVTK